MTKATPEQLAARAEYMRLYRLAKLESERARIREYSGRPDVKERRRARDSTPEKNELRRQRAQDPEVKQRIADKRRAKILANPEWYSGVLAKQRKNRTGFDPDLVRAMLLHQGNKCAICCRDFTGRQIRADHCHDSGKPRGLLCHHCNIIEGMLKSMNLSPLEFAHNLDSYLKSPPSEAVMLPVK